MAICSLSYLDLCYLKILSFATFEHVSPDPSAAVAPFFGSLFELSRPSYTTMEFECSIYPLLAWEVDHGMEFDTETSPEMNERSFLLMHLFRMFRSNHRCHLRLAGASQEQSVCLPQMLH